MGEEVEVDVEALIKKATGLPDPDPRPHLNVVFIGHVDAGKSTTCGNILVLTGQVDERAIEKYERDAAEKGRASWFLAYILDCNEDERERGKTVELARAAFTLENHRFTILDAPGHRAFVPAMIAGAAQADVGVLIISARKGEFEAGFEKGGQTREHAVLAKTLGVTHLVVAINKMDEPTVEWSQERYSTIEKALTQYLKSCGYAPNTVHFLPLSGYTGQNLKVKASDPCWGESAKKASWWGPDKPTLFEILNSLTPPDRNPKAPIRVPLLEGFRDGAVCSVGKVEQGTLVARMDTVIMPGNVKTKITGVLVNETEVKYAVPGENVVIRLQGCEESDIPRGSVLCPANNLCSVARVLRVQALIIELLETRPILTAGYGCVLHCHTAMEEALIIKLVESVDKATKKKKINPPFVKANTLVVFEVELTQPIAVETFTVCQQLGRVTLRDEGKTIAIGKIMAIVE